MGLCGSLRVLACVSKRVRYLAQVQSLGDEPGSGRSLGGRHVQQNGVNLMKERRNLRTIRPPQLAVSLEQQALGPADLRAHTDTHTTHGGVIVRMLPSGGG